MMTFLANLTLFTFVMFATIYWYLWYKLGPSLIREIIERLKGRRHRTEAKSPEIEKFLNQLDYKHFFVIDSSVVYGMAQPLSKEVLISSKIYNSKNFNLIKYVLTHEIAHKRQGNTKWGIVFFVFWIFCFLVVYFKFSPTLPIILLWAFIIGRIAMFFQRKFEDMADREAARILGKENVAKAIRDIFVLNKTPLEKRSWWWDKLVINRDYPSRMEVIGYS